MNDHPPTSSPDDAPPSSTERIHALLDAGRVAEARALLREVLAPGVDPDGARDLARACEATGLSASAIQAWRAVLARHREDAEALERLVHLHGERGDTDRAEACRERLARMGSTVEDDPPEQPDDDAEPPVPGDPGEGDLARFVALFAGRAGVHARQWKRGDQYGYSPVRTPLSADLVRSHLDGGITLGSYLVRRGDRTTQVVLDLDATSAAIERVWGHREQTRALRRKIHEAGLALRRGLVEAGLDPLFVDSGFKGRHLWIFLPDAVSAARARALGHAWARAWGPDDTDLVVEVFPRQDRVPAGGLGNLVKLPLGIHLRTGRRCQVLDAEGYPVADPWPRLRGIRKVPLDEIPPPAPVLVPDPEPARTPEDEAPAVEAAPPPAPFTEGDFQALPRLAAVLQGCPLLGEVVETALDERRLHRSRRIALEHSIGHLPEGVEAVNYLLDRCHRPGDEKMGAPHSGSPISCRSVRRRLKDIAGRIRCECAFDEPHSYPNPLLHARHIAGTGREEKTRVPRNLESLLAAMNRLEERRRRCEEELQGVRAQVARRLSDLPGGQYRTDEGTWILEDEEGMPAVRFEREGTG